MKPVAILGAGIAGLAVARQLKASSVPFIVFEAGPRIAGLASNFADADGFTYDFGAHFVTNRLAEDIGISDRCRDVPRYSESVWRNGKSYSYPFGLMSIPRFALGGAFSKLSLFREEPVTAKDWFRAQYGQPLADEVALPLLEAWSGLPAHQLSRSVGESMPGSLLQTLWLTAARKWTGKAIAIGYSREQPHGTNVWHVYPEGGLGLLCEKLAEGLSDSIQLRSPVEEIMVRDGRVEAVRSKGQAVEVAAAVSTAPVNVLSKLVTGTDRLAHLARFRYRPMVFVNLRLKGRSVLPDVVLWTPDSQLPFFRLTEVSASMPWTAPDNHSLVTCDIGCQIDDAYWKMSDLELGNLCIQHLQTICPGIQNRYLGCRVLKTAVAYPVFSLEYEDQRKALESGTGVDGLWSVGRNGEFMHLFMEDVYLRSTRKGMEICDYVRGAAERAPSRIDELEPRKIPGNPAVQVISA